MVEGISYLGAMVWSKENHESVGKFEEAETGMHHFRPMLNSSNKHYHNQEAAQNAVVGIRLVT